jgi:hypothetical protein
MNARHFLIMSIVVILANDVPSALKMPIAQKIGIPLDACTSQLWDFNAVLGELLPFLLGLRINGYACVY